MQNGCEGGRFRVARSLPLASAKGASNHGAKCSAKAAKHGCIDILAELADSESSIAVQHTEPCRAESPPTMPSSGGWRKVCEGPDDDGSVASRSRSFALVRLVEDTLLDGDLAANGWRFEKPSQRAMCAPYCFMRFMGCEWGSDLNAVLVAACKRGSITMLDRPLQVLEYFLPKPTTDVTNSDASGDTRM